MPIRKKLEIEKQVKFAEPEAAKPVAEKHIKKPSNKREMTVDPKTGETKLAIIDDFGTQEIKPHGMIIWGAGRENYSIMPDDPLSAKMETHWTEGRKRGKWETRTETFGRLTATKTHWIVWGKIEAYEGKKQVFTREFNQTIERKLQ